jgi:hypothetical protein
LLGEYVNVESDAVTIDIPQEVESYLDARVVEYIAELETLANQAYAELLHAIDAVDWDNLEIESLQRSSLERYLVKIEKHWVAWTIDGVLIAINAGIVAAKCLPFVGKSLAIKAIREGIPAGIKLLASIVAGLDSILALFNHFLGKFSDSQLLSWLTIGGIIANILDWIDSDGYNGWITI